MKIPPLKMTAAILLLVALGGIWRTVSKNELSSGNDPIALVQEGNHQQGMLVSVSFFGKIFTLSAQPGPGFSNLYQPIRSSGWGWLTGLLLISGLVILIPLLLRRRNELDRLILERTEEIHLQVGALNAAANAILITDRNGVIKWVNQAFTLFTGYAAEEAIGRTPAVLKSGQHDAAFHKKLWATILAGDVWRGEIVNRRKDGGFYTEDMTITPIKNGQGVITHFVAVKQDITEKKQVQADIQQAEFDLRQAQKMESIGNLAAGMAHEINSPLQSMHNNVQFLGDAFSSLSEWHQKAHAILSENLPPNSASALEAADKKADLDYFFTEIPLALEQSKAAIDRVTEIVYAMKEFSRPKEVTATQIDLNQAISSTLTVCRSEWKQVARLVTSFEKDLPLVSCVASEINQVILNLVVNAAHAIASSSDANLAQRGDDEPKDTITVSTRHEGDWVEVRVSDTGPGMSEAVKAHVFDPFYTTKEVGKGTGLGLLIAYAIIEKKHGGKIRFETELGVGTSFSFRLPLTRASILSDLPLIN